MSDPIEERRPETEQPKVIYEFQHTDEHGNPIIDPRTGKQAFTNLTGADYKEIADKMKDSYLNVTRAFNRARNYKPVPKEDMPQPKQLTVEEERQAVMDLQDPAKARGAGRKLFGVEDLEAEQAALRKDQFAARSAQAGYQFMARHVEEYFPCQANGQVMRDYIVANALDPTVVDNYEVAFNAVRDRLAIRPMSQPPMEAAPPVPPQRRPERSSGGIQPGAMTGQRPPRRRANEVTKESINEMRRTPDGRAEYKKRMRDPEFVRQVTALFAQT